MADGRIDVADIAVLKAKRHAPASGNRDAVVPLQESFCPGKAGPGDHPTRTRPLRSPRAPPLASKHGEGAPPGAAPSRLGVLTVSRQPGSCEIRSTRARPKAIRALPKREDPVPMATTTTTIKRTTGAWAWQVITRDGTDWRQGARSSRSDAENDARAARDALESGDPDPVR